MTGANALAASGAVRELIESLVLGAREREGANLAIQAMPNPSMFAAAKQAAAETLDRLQAAMDDAGGTDVPEALLPLRDAALALAVPVEELWREETIVLDGLAGGDRVAAIAAQRRSEPLFQPTEDGMAALVAAAHRLADDDPAAFAGLALSRPAVIGLAFPDPGDPDDRSDEPLDVEAWLAGFRETLPDGDAAGRIAAMWAEAERWQVRAGELRLGRHDLPAGMTVARWSRELAEAEERVSALIRSLEEDEGFDPLGGDLPALPGSTRRFTLAADGSGDFSTFEDAMREVPSGATLAIRPGRYEPGGLVAKSLDIVGDGPAGEIVICSDFHSVIPVQSLGGTLRGVTVRNTGGPDRYALWVTDGWFTVEDCVLECDGEAVVHVTGPRAAPRLVGCTLKGAAHGALVRLGGVVLVGSRVVGARGAGIMVERGGWASVMRSEVSGNGEAGIDLAAGAGAGIRHSRIDGNGGPGLRVAGGAWATIERSRIAGNTGPDVLDFPGSSVESDGEPYEEPALPLGAVLETLLVSEAQVEAIGRHVGEVLERTGDMAELERLGILAKVHADWATGLLRRFGEVERPEGLLHLVREAGQLLEDSEAFARKLADAVAETAGGEIGDWSAASGSAQIARDRCLRRLEAIGFMLAFLRHRDPAAFAALRLSEDALGSPWLAIWQEALPPGAGEHDDEMTRAMALGVTIVPLPASLMDRRGEPLEPVLDGPGGDAERLYWRLWKVKDSDAGAALRDEFYEILAASLRRLIEREDGAGLSPLEHVATIAARRMVDLSGTSAGAVTCSGGYCYPGMSTDLGEPRADNQWYLLKIPEASLVGEIARQAMGLRHFHISVSTGRGAQAGYLPVFWRNRGLVEGDMDILLLADPGHRAFDFARERIAAIAADRDARIAEWAPRARAFLESLPAA